MKFILISPTPVFESFYTAANCLVDWFRSAWSISQLCFPKLNKSEWFTSNKEKITRMENFLKANPKVSYFNVFSILYPDEYCKNNDQNSFLYKGGII